MRIFVGSVYKCGAKIGEKGGCLGVRSGELMRHLQNMGHSAETLQSLIYLFDDNRLPNSLRGPFVFRITKGFWNHCPEARDRRLHEIFAIMQCDVWEREQTPQFELTFTAVDQPIIVRLTSR